MQTSTFRRRRTILVILFALGATILFFGPWGLPPALKDITPANLSRASVAQLVRGGPKVDEIYGLLHLVTASGGRQLSSDEGFDPAVKVELGVYAGSESISWKKTAKEINKEYPVVVFSKTYCPYSRKAKALLESYKLTPPPKIIEVDLREDGDVMKVLLTRLTKHSTFPNVIVKGKSIGGSDSLQSLHQSGKLAEIFEEAGIKVDMVTA